MVPGHPAVGATDAARRAQDHRRGMRTRGVLRARGHDPSAKSRTRTRRRRGLRGCPGMPGRGPPARREAPHGSLRAVRREWKATRRQQRNTARRPGRTAIDGSRDHRGSVAALHPESDTGHLTGALERQPAPARTAKGSVAEQGALLWCSPPGARFPEPQPSRPRVGRNVQDHRQPHQQPPVGRHNDCRTQADPYSLKPRSRCHSARRPRGRNDQRTPVQVLGGSDLNVRSPIVAGTVSVADPQLRLEK